MSEENEQLCGKCGGTGYVCWTKDDDRCPHCGGTGREGPTGRQIIEFYEAIANRFCAWIEGVCWHEWEEAPRLDDLTYEYKCSHCDGWITAVGENTNYMHDSNAMLNRVMTSDKMPELFYYFLILYNRIRGTIDVDADFRDGFSYCISKGKVPFARNEAKSKPSYAFNLSILQALMQTPLWTEYLETLKEE